jgi:hypothetical protein
MTTNDPTADVLDDEFEPYEPEAPAHQDPDAETVVHVDHPDEEAVVDEVDLAPQEPPR